MDRVLAGLLLLAALQMDLVAHAAGNGEKSSGQQERIGQPQTRPTRKIVYRPPLRGAPAAAVRVGGGTRGGSDSDGGLPSLCVLTPDHMAMTAKEQPSLFWYLSKATSLRVEITLTRDGDADPVLELSCDSSPTAGIQQLDLARHGVKLDPDTPYEWVIALVLDPKSRSRDIVASGVIRRVTLPEGASQRLTKASAAERVAIYAEQGFWFDAMELLATMIETDPSNREIRAGLLEQVGLKEVAEWDLRALTGQ